MKQFEKLRWQFLLSMILVTGMVANAFSSETKPDTKSEIKLAAKPLNYQDLRNETLSKIINDFLSC